MMDAPILRTLGQLSNVMLEFATEVNRCPGLGLARPSSIAWAGKGDYQHQAHFTIAVETTNDVGYELCWFVEISEEGGRYSVERGLYGSGRSERYRGGQHLLFELPVVEYASHADLCAGIVELGNELRRSIGASLAVVPND